MYYIFMNILSIDSSGPQLSVAIKQDDKIFYKQYEKDKRASKIILSTIDNLLIKNNISLASINAIVFNKGPASFTGTRVAAAVTQAIGYTHNIPVLGISSMSLMAYVYYTKSKKIKFICIKKAYGKMFYIAKFDISKNKFEPINQIDLVNFKDIRLVNDSYYVLDCFNEFNNTSNNKLATLINFSHEDYILDAKSILTYAENNCSFDSSFKLEETFPDYANHNIEN